MRASERCAHPQACGVTSHVVGTEAARACARRASRAPAGAAMAPPAPAQVSFSQVAAALKAADLGACPITTALPRAERATEVESQVGAAHLDAAAAGGWQSASGRAHPTGGYADVVVDVFAGKQVRAVARYRNDQGLVHRQDGPALVAHRPDGHVAQALWREHGLAHRTNGPAEMRSGTGETPLFFLGGVELCADPQERDSDTRRWATWARYVDEVALGSDPVEAVAWLAVSTRTGAHLARELRESGQDPVALAAAHDAGARGHRALVAVAARRAPASWTAAT